MSSRIYSVSEALIQVAHEPVVYGNPDRSPNFARPINAATNNWNPMSSEDKSPVALAATAVGLSEAELLSSRNERLSELENIISHKSFDEWTRFLKGILSRMRKSRKRRTSLMLTTDRAVVCGTMKMTKDWSDAEQQIYNEDCQGDDFYERMWERDVQRRRIRNEFETLLIRIRNGDRKRADMEAGLLALSDIDHLRVEYEDIRAGMYRLRAESDALQFDEKQAHESLMNLMRGEGDHLSSAQENEEDQQDSSTSEEEEDIADEYQPHKRARLDEVS
ncbi:hypothetical protein PROFUN_15681 [Planoprotostelium fungivorum]|uniref:Uncharacterized protein n=2 Tax=Planoprotostelium fungivorum TaxID=1890364 RepID=A0A2P6MV36_9EUKA|nr:hypothetical protein PROFUN_15681 [Planoprotostelium fungivorum]